MNADQAKSLARALAERTDLSPAAKRRILASVGLPSEYMPHQGAKERARRLRQLLKNQQRGA